MFPYFISIQARSKLTKILPFLTPGRLRFLSVSKSILDLTHCLKENENQDYEWSSIGSDNDDGGIRVAKCSVFALSNVYQN